MSSHVREVERRVNRETGTTIVLQDLGAGTSDQRWETICVDHGAVCSHDTRPIARSFMSCPTEWCEDCRDAPAYDRKSYNRGWRTSMNATGSFALDNADARGEPDEWYDGYLDAATGRAKWHSRDCQAHHNGPGGCGEA